MRRTSRVTVTVTLAAAAAVLVTVTVTQTQAQAQCTFEDQLPQGCDWRWNSSDWQRFRAGQPPQPANYTAGPARDGDDRPDGHYLLSVNWKARELRLWSTKYSGTRDLCRLEFLSHMANMGDGLVKIVIETASSKNTSWVVGEHAGIVSRTWQKYTFNIGRIKQEFNIVIEFFPGKYFPSHVALDNIQLLDCIPEKKKEECLSSQFMCGNTTHCIDHHQVCDMSIDCPDGSDELHSCG